MFTVFNYSLVFAVAVLVLIMLVMGFASGVENLEASFSADFNNAFASAADPTK